MRISYWSSDVCSSDLDAGHDDGAYLARSKPGRSADPVRNAPPIGKTVPQARQTIAELLPCATAQEAKRQKPQRGDRRYRQAPGKAITSHRSEEHTSELQSLMRSSYAVFCLKKKKPPHLYIQHIINKRQTLNTSNHQ